MTLLICFRIKHHFVSVSCREEHYVDLRLILPMIRLNLKLSPTKISLKDKSRLYQVSKQSVFAAVVNLVLLIRGGAQS